MLTPIKESCLIKPQDIKPSSKYLEVIGAINPAATRLPSGDILLYVRVIEKLIKTNDSEYIYSPRFSGEDEFKLSIDKFKKDEIESSSELDFVFHDGTKRLTFISHLRAVLLDKNGFKIKSIDKKPSFYGLRWDGELGIEDPRITRIGDIYAMTYVSLSRDQNVSTALAISHDCKNWYRRGIIFEQQNKDAVILPELINNHYYAFNRPEGTFEFSAPKIWLSESKDLEIWGRSKAIHLAENKKEWDSGRVGAGPPPIKTKNGWLLIYHGVNEKIISEKNKRLVYSAGAALFDLKNPGKLIGKSKEPIIIPSKGYEIGILERKEVFFPTGIVQDLDKKSILIYSGGGDINTTAKKFYFNDILKAIKPVK